MRPPREPLFLARQSYRRRRLADAAKVLPLVGAILLFLPVLWASEARTASGLVYIFGVWTVLICVVGVMSSRLTGGDAPDAPDEPPPGDSARE